jgi:hypothetical protein
MQGTTDKVIKLSPDIVQKDYWRNKETFADLFNAYLFCGRQVIKADELTERDTDSSTVLEQGDTDVAVKGARDTISTAMTFKGVEYAILGIEDQNYIHYGMPFQVEEYDVVSYKKQYKELTGRYKDTGELHGNERMSGIKKSDRFTPVVTVVVYFGSEPWDGPVSLYEMLNLPDELKPFVNDFKINLIEVRDNNLVFNNQDNRDLFTLLRIIYDNKLDRKAKRIQLEEYSNNHTVDRSVLKVIAATSKLNLNVNDEKEEITVCKLWDEVRAEGKAEGKAEGRAEGRAEGKAEGRAEGKAEGKSEGEDKLARLINRLISDKRLDDVSKASNDKTIRQALYKEYGITD